ncbi:MAG TPA: hypothetical protein VHI96_00250 [Solirubrobacterales bacterium]|jgi:hypothetical protein|nr:hypothetical protein [Solirubrobacterales bacterium]
MNRATLEWYELLARSLTWIAGIVLLLSAVAAIVIAGSENSAPLLEDLEKQGRGVAALWALGGGLTAAGLLAAAGAILRLLVTERLERLGPAVAAGRAGSGEQLPLGGDRSEDEPPRSPRRRERR